MKPGEVIDVCGGYRLLKRLGTGGFAEVWQVESVQGGIKAALKILIQPVDNEESQREMQSLEVIKNVRHPYLLQTWNFARWNDRMVVIMDLADGSLRDRLKEYAREHRCGLPVDELLRYFFEAGEALDYLHSLNIIHRDIKPDNLLLRSGHIVVCDFGLVRLKDRLMMSVSSSGTPAYMAPETWHGRAGAATDQYALAATYAELRLNRRPFQANDYAGIMIDHLQSQPLLDPMPAPEQQVILRAMAKEPANRYPSCVAMVQALADVAPNALLSRRFGGSGSMPAVQATSGPGPGAAPQTMMRHDLRTMQPGGFPQATPTGSGQPMPSAPAASTPSSLHGLPTQQGPPPQAPPNFQPTLGQHDGPVNLGQSLNPNIDWGDAPGTGSGSGSFQTSRDNQPGYNPHAPQNTQPGVSLPSQPAYAPQGYSQPPVYAPNPSAYGVNVSGPDMFVEVAPDPAQYAPYPPPQSPPPPSRLPLIALLIGLSGLVLLGTAVGVWFLLQPPPAPGTFTVQKPADVKLQPGRSHTAKVAVERKGYKGSLKLTFSSLKNITVAPVEIQAGTDAVDVRFEVAHLADSGSQTLTVTATPEQGEAQKIDWVLVVEPGGTQENLWLPVGFQALGPETIEAGGKRWYRQIEKKLAGGPAVVFSLIPANPPFYLLQDKVTNDVFAAYVKANAGAVTSPWEKGGLTADGDTGTGNGKLPALRMTHGEAVGAAKWLGGVLPSATQLDFAAALDEPRGAAVNRRATGPAGAGATPSDRSKYLVNDLAGNGWEWTSDEVSLASGKAIVLRGQRYTAREALTAKMVQEQQREPLTCAANHASPYVGFRVVLPTQP